MMPVSVSRWLQPLPQWSAIALHPPQELVHVRLKAADGEFDLTRNNVIVALRPLTVAIGMDGPLSLALQKTDSCELHFINARDGDMLGVLGLERQQDWTTNGIALALFGVTGGTHRCLGWPGRPWNRWLQDRAVRAGSKPGNFALSPAATQQIMIFYICPRPVVLVSVDGGSHSNLFPMDLIGPVASDRFTLALRSTSASVEPRGAWRYRTCPRATTKLLTAWALTTRTRRSIGRVCPSDWAVPRFFHCRFRNGRCAFASLRSSMSGRLARIPCSWPRPARTA